MASKKMISGEVSDFRDKPKNIQVAAGSTVAECVVAAGFSVDPKNDPKEKKLRLNCKPCKWTDKVMKKDFCIYFIPNTKGGHGI